jgi:hypothetical protein
MNWRSRVSILTSLVGDTFRQSMASSLFWLMLGASVLIVAVCFSLDVDGASEVFRPGERPDFLPRGTEDKALSHAEAQGVDVIRGELGIGFGSVRVPLGRDARDAVRYVQLILAGLVADTAGVLLALVWTAAFLPAFIEARAVSVLLAKPVGRSALVLGKYLGVVAFVAVQALVFIGGTWLALGARTGIWDVRYWWSLPMLVLHFAIFFSFSVLLAVCTRSTIVCVLGSILFWFICWGMNFGRHAVVAASNFTPESTYSAPLRWAAETGYWVLPKPADLGLLLFDALDASKYFETITAAQLAREQNAFSPLLSLVTSLLFAAFALVATAEQFEAADY